MCAQLLQSCLTLCKFTDWSLPDSSTHGIFQARILERAVISYSRGSSPPSDWTRVSCISCIGGWIFYHCATWETLQDTTDYIHVFKSSTDSFIASVCYLDKVNSDNVRITKKSSLIHITLLLSLFPLFNMTMILQFAWQLLMDARCLENNSLVGFCSWAL